MVGIARLWLCRIGQWRSLGTFHTEHHDDRRSRRRPWGGAAGGQRLPDLRNLPHGGFVDLERRHATDVYAFRGGSDLCGGTSRGVTQPFWRPDRYHGRRFCLGRPYHFLAIRWAIFSAAIAAVQFRGSERLVDRPDIPVGNESLPADRLDACPRLFPWNCDSTRLHLRGS